MYPNFRQPEGEGGSQYFVQQPDNQISQSLAQLNQREACMHSKTRNLRANDDKLSAYHAWNSWQVQRLHHMQET